MGFREETWNGKVIWRASNTKALFDFLYLKKLQDTTVELTTDLRINWNTFSPEEFSEFQTYVARSKSKKMMRIGSVIQKFYVSQ